MPYEVIAERAVSVTTLRANSPRPASDIDLESSRVTGLLLIVALACGGCVPVTMQQRASTPGEERLHPSIPAPVRSLYSDDTRDWLNPRITIRAEGIEVVRPGSQPMTVAVRELRRVLVGLPIAAWPYGRVIRASDIGIVRGDLSDVGAINRNHRAAEQVLKALDIEIGWIPS
jgi:hypothetical protein